MEKLIFLLLFLAAPSLAGPEESPFQEGNAFYAAGKFSEAAQKYETSSQSGLKHWILEFNLGNAYYREGRIGKAILHYERAFQLNSGQSDVIYNLNLASTRAGDPKFPSSALLITGWRIYFYPSVNTLALWVSLLFIVLCAGAAMMAAGKYGLRWDALLGVLGLFIVGVIWLGSRVYILENPKGVVVTSVAEVRSGPSTTYPANFTVPEGHRVLLLEQQESVQGWRQIGIPREGFRGWVPDTSVDVI